MKGLSRLKPTKKKKYLYRWQVDSQTETISGKVWATGIATAAQKVAGLHLTDKINYFKLTIEKTEKEKN